MKKRSHRRQRIEIKKLENKSVKQVTFSKRRSGLFKKASELSILCGCEVALIVFSPNAKLFSFGHPSVDAVLRHLSAAESVSPPQQQFQGLVGDFEGERRRLAAAEERRRGLPCREFWWDAAAEGMEAAELDDHLAALVELRANLALKLNSPTASSTVSFYGDHDVNNTNY